MSQIIELNSYPSTNLYAKEHIKDLNHLDIVIANSQTSGRGRSKNKWISPPGNLYSSIIFKEDINQFHIPIIISLAIKETINKLKKENAVCLKWPNDIHYYDKKTATHHKLGGILSEKLEDSIIIGIGINIKNSPDIEKYKTSYLNKIKINLSKNDLILKILKEFKKLLTIYKDKGFKNIKLNWLKYSCHQNKSIKIDNKIGIFKDLDSNGFAIIEINSLSQTIMAGSLEFLDNKNHKNI